MLACTILDWTFPSTRSPVSVPDDFFFLSRICFYLFSFVTFFSSQNDTEVNAPLTSSKITDTSSPKGNDRSPENQHMNYLKHTKY